MAEHSHGSKISILEASKAKTSVSTPGIRSVTDKMTTEGEILEKLEGLTRDAARHQLETLRSILQRNGNSRYLRPFLGDHPGQVDVATFLREVPLSSYDDYTDHISQMADGTVDGGDPILCADPLTCFFYSSGTTSKRPKMIPYYDTPLSRAATSIAQQSSLAVLRKLFPPPSLANKGLWFIYAGNVTRTKGGFKVMAATAYLMQSAKLRSSQFLSDCISPQEVILGSDVDCQIYCHLLCGLRHLHKIENIQAPYAIGLVRAFCLLEEKWKVLCKDIEKGFLSWDTSDTAMKDSVNKALGGPRNDLSERIRLICEEKSWEGILIKLWPNLKYIKCVTTGSMMHYYPKLKHYAGEVPILGGDYFASECPVGINLDPEQPPEKTRFVVLPTGAYFEFLPYDPNENSVADREVVDISGVEVGKIYELVVTTLRGFYRFRLGDIVRVTGFYNSSPELEFVMRAPKPSELVTERDLISVVEKTRVLLEDVLGAEITEYACSLDLDLSPHQLKIYLEVKSVSFEDKLKDRMIDLTRCCASLEDNFGGIYKVHKERGKLRPLLVYIITPRSFDRLLHIAIEKGASASQYKHPKIIRNREISDFLEGVALATICSDSKDA